jgi:transcriptional regulator with XRE-family HTH domain
MKNLNIRERRESLGLTQVQLSEMVSRRAGKPFSQQSLQKLESRQDSGSGASSRFMHHILEVLEERELGPRGELMRIARTIDASRLDTAIAVLEAIRDKSH